MQTIKNWIRKASARLNESGIPSARLDTELILAHVIEKDRTYLHGHDQETVAIKLLKKADNYIERRASHEPLAYILGYKEFFGHKFTVSQKTLIPRPESETIIEILLDILSYEIRKHPVKLVDIGTGCGCLGISAKLAIPNLDVALTDISEEALKIASKNAHDLGVDIKIINSYLLNDYRDRPDIIIANLPYVDRQWITSKETRFEPDIALFSSDNGIYLIKKLISSASSVLKSNGYLIVEADPRQHSNIINYACDKLFEAVSQRDYVLVFKLCQKHRY